MTHVIADMLAEARKLHADPTLHLSYDYDLDAWTVIGKTYRTTHFADELAAVMCAVVDAHPGTCRCLDCMEVRNG